jgi:hypothetical protein
LGKFDYEKPLEEVLKDVEALKAKYGEKAVLNIFPWENVEYFGLNTNSFEIIRPSTEDEIKEFKEYMKTHFPPKTAKKMRIKQLEEELKRLKEESVDEDGVKEHVLTKFAEAIGFKIPLEEQSVMILPSDPVIKKEVPPTLEEKMEFSKKLSSAFDMTTVYAEQQKKLEAEKAKRTAK